MISQKTKTPKTKAQKTPQKRILDKKVSSCKDHIISQHKKIPSNITLPHRQKDVNVKILNLHNINFS